MLNVNYDNSDLVVRSAVNEYANVRYCILGQGVVLILCINCILTGDLDVVDSRQLALAPEVGVEGTSQVDISHGVASLALACVGVNEQDYGVLAVNNSVSVLICILAACCGPLGVLVIAVQGDVARSVIVSGYVVVSLLVLAVLDVSQSVASCRVREDVALAHVSSLGIIGGNGDLLSAIPSGDDVNSAVSGAGLLLNVLQNNCVVVGRAAGGVLAKVDECSLCVVAVAGLVSNCCSCTQGAIVARSGLAGYYLVVAVVAVVVSLGLNEYNAGCFVVQTGDGGLVRQSYSALDRAVGLNGTSSYVLVVAVGVNLRSVLIVGVLEAQTSQGVNVLGYLVGYEHRLCLGGTQR